MKKKYFDIESIAIDSLINRAVSLRKILVSNKTTDSFLRNTVTRAYEIVMHELTENLLKKGGFFKTI